MNRSSRRTRERPHWTVKTNRNLRAAWLACAFVFVSVHLWGQGAPLWAWLGVALQFLVYPQVLYWRARRARDSLRAEQHNLRLDSLCMGAWAAALAFPLWITFTLFVNTAMGNAISQGRRGMAWSLGLFLAGALALTPWAWGDATVWLADSPWVTAACVATLVWYLLAVAQIAYSQNLALRVIREKLQQREVELHAANHALFVRLGEIEHLQAILKEQANVDPLTGLFNRRYLQATLEREWARCQREQQPLCVMLIDIDHFKRVNDTHGHGVGDEVLAALGRLLSGGVRTEDLACRYGGEEFLVLLPKMPLDLAVERAQSLRQAFAELDISVEGVRVPLSLSVGVAVAPDHAQTPSDLVRHADEALYRAKAEGRNRVRVFSPGDRAV